MTKKNIIDKTLKILTLLPEEKAIEVFDFADYIIKKHEEQTLVMELQKAVSEGESFEFLRAEEDLYTEDDLKEIYHE